MAETTDRNVASISKKDVETVKEQLDTIYKDISELSSSLFKELGGDPKSDDPISYTVEFDQVSDELKNQIIGYTARIEHNWAWVNKTLNSIFLTPKTESTSEPPPDPPDDSKP